MHKNKQLEALKRGIRRYKLKNNTPEKARAGLIANGILNEDGSPSKNYYTEEQIAEFYEAKHRHQSGRDWLILNDNSWDEYCKQWY
jgi:hypothetical protein